MFIHCQTSGPLGTSNVVLQPTWMLGKKLVKQLGVAVGGQGGIN